MEGSELARPVQDATARTAATPEPRRSVGTARWLVLGLLLLVLAGCAAGPNPEVGAAAEDGVVAGFWLGLWHGVIAPVTFFISLFTDTVSLYEVHNSGNWYDAGFFLGFGVLLGGGGAGGRRAG